MTPIVYPYFLGNTHRDESGFEIHVGNIKLKPDLFVIKVVFDPVILDASYSPADIVADTLKEKILEAISQYMRDKMPIPWRVKDEGKEGKG